MSDRLDDAIAILTGDECDGIVDLVLCMRNGIVEAHARDGMVAFTAQGPLHMNGRNPLEHGDPGAMSPLEAERANVRPSNRANHYPFAYDNIAHLFDHPHAPDIAVVHTPAHNWEERGGHRGEHGSPNLIQSRAPLIAAGRGIRRLGSIPRAARMVDIAPTLTLLAGGRPRPDGPLIARQHGRVLEEILDLDDPPKRVVAFLCDGTNANVLYAMARAGELPNTAKLMDAGTVYEHGLIASFPTVTLANHTTALTGVHPGVHGVLHNAYYERATGRAVNTNSPATWHLARNEIASDVETVYEALARSGAGFTASINEPCDRGASYATFDAVRDGGEVVQRLQTALPDPTAIPGATQTFVRTKPEYAWSTAADYMAVQQAGALWRGDAGNPRPRFMWVNLILNDAGNHAGGPYSDIGHAALRDTDARLGEIMDAIGDDDTAYVVLADHGMEESDPECTGDYSEALEKAGIAFRDEGFGFLYLG
ncbi:MAG TPA: alkaline phosphatase family protein [Actinomycetota bacterium]|nr:alkaline phosphatase family protein [Actinomycetota bacterium]